jgi:hypothetical protein
LLNYCPDEFGVEILDNASARSLRADVKDALILACVRDIVSNQVLDEATDGGKPAVARSRRVGARRLKMIKELQHRLRTNVINLKAMDLPFDAPGQEQEEETQCVAVGADRVRTGTSRTPEMGVEVRLYELRQTGLLTFHKGDASR